MPISPKNYSFVSHWRVSAPIKTVESALLNTEDWQKWWNGLENIKMIHEDVGVGTQFDCQWRSMTGYRINLRITITGYDKGRTISFDSVGDLVGSGHFAISSSNGTVTDIIIRWNVSTTKRWMNIFAPILKPIFVINHNRLMSQAHKGLDRYILLKK